jgi:acetyl esterase
MTLDAQTAALLQQMQEGGQPPLNQLGVEVARTALRQMLQLLDIAPTPVARRIERTIPGADGEEMAVRIYWPKTDDVTGPPPILLLFPGGGFSLGDLETHESMARYYCAYGRVIVISVDYRHAPEHKFPAGVEDCFAALCWASDHAGELGGDAARIAIVGDSAGGNLAAAVGLLARDRGGPKIADQILIYPAVDMHVDTGYASRKTFGGGEYVLSYDDMVWLTGLYFETPDQADDPRASPILADDLSGLPPTLIITAGYDQMVDEAKDYADRLEAAGVPVDYVCFESTIHGFLSFGGMLDVGKQGLDLVVRRLTALGGKQDHGE